MRENSRELSRAVRIHRLSIGIGGPEGAERHTFDHPLHLHLPGIEHALDPALFPREKLDELNLSVTDANQWGRSGNERLTAPISSFTTLVRPSRALSTPLWMRTRRRAT
jgi:hypothetical protein